MVKNQIVKNHFVKKISTIQLGKNFRSFGQKSNRQKIISSNNQIVKNHFVKNQMVKSHFVKNQIVKNHLGKEIIAKIPKYI